MGKRFDRLLGRRPKGEQRDWSVIPRLAGRTEPHYETGAAKAFAEVLYRGMAVYTPPVRRPEDDRTRALDFATDAASLYCNPELERRLRLYRNVAVDYSLGERTAEELDVAREDFARGCRLALGTNT